MDEKRRYTFCDVSPFCCGIGPVSRFFRPQVGFVFSFSTAMGVGAVKE